MAGIGFELKKIYRKEGIARGTIGIMYSTMVTIGPMILVMVAILSLYIFLGIKNVSYAERELLFSTVLYIFIFAMIFTSPINVIFSRYVADKFFKEKYDGILDSYYLGLFICGGLASLVALPIGYSLKVRGGISFEYIFLAYALWISVIILYFSITYLHATKDYKMITLFFGVGMVIGFASAFFLRRIIEVGIVFSVLTGLAIGFFTIAVLVVAYIKQYFPSMKGEYKESLSYFWSSKKILLANLFYALGLYCHNFIFWHIEGRTVVAQTFYSNQAYDLASCLAMFTNVFVMVSFTVVAETRFHEVYKEFMESVLGNTYKVITKNKRKLFRTLTQQIGQIFATQMAITSIIFILISSYGALIGVDDVTLSIYPVLTVAFLGIFIMNGNLIYLYYFDDSTGALVTGALFCMGTLIGSLWSRNLATSWWGAGVFLGMIIGLTYSYFRIRWLERNLDEFIFCGYEVVNSTTSQNPRVNVVYRKAE